MHIEDNRHNTASFFKMGSYFINTDLLNALPSLTSGIIPDACMYIDTIHVIDASDIQKDLITYIHVNSLEQKGSVFTASKEQK